MEEKNRSGGGQQRRREKEPLEEQLVYWTPGAEVGLDAAQRSGQHLTKGHDPGDQVEGNTGELQTLKLYFWYLRE